MKRLVPYPLLSVLLLLFWLILNQSVSLGHILLGIVLAIGAGLALSALRVPKVRIRNIRAIATLTIMVLCDVVRSNIAVAKLVMKPGKSRYTSGFISMRIDMRNPYGLTALAIIITSTPGTIWVNFDSATGMLLIHVLDLVDEETWIDTIKHGYERLLMEIFE